MNAGAVRFRILHSARAEGKSITHYLFLFVGITIWLYRQRGTGSVIWRGRLVGPSRSSRISWQRKRSTRPGTSAYLGNVYQLSTGSRHWVSRNGEESAHLPEEGVFIHYVCVYRLGYSPAALVAFASNLNLGSRHLLQLQIFQASTAGAGTIEFQGR